MMRPRQVWVVLLLLAISGCQEAKKPTKVYDSLNSSAEWTASRRPSRLLSESGQAASRTPAASMTFNPPPAGPLGDDTLAIFRAAKPTQLSPDLQAAVIAWGPVGGEMKVTTGPWSKKIRDAFLSLNLDPPRQLPGGSLFRQGLVLVRVKGDIGPWDKRAGRLPRLRPLTHSLVRMKGQGSTMTAIDPQEKKWSIATWRLLAIVVAADPKPGGLQVEYSEDVEFQESLDWNDTGRRVRDIWISNLEVVPGAPKRVLWKATVHSTMSEDDRSTLRASAKGQVPAPIPEGPYQRSGDNLWMQKWWIREDPKTAPPLEIWRPLWKTGTIASDLF